LTIFFIKSSSVWKQCHKTFACCGLKSSFIVREKGSEGLILRPRVASKELLLLRSLNARARLIEKEKQQYYNLEKGYEGEVQFDRYMQQNLLQDRYIVNDLLLEKNNTKFQLDSVHIAQSTAYHFEIKNYEGDYYIESDRFFTFSGKEILNPFHQVKRSESLLRQLMNSLGFPLSLESYLIFVNPEFYLYNAPKDPSIIFPNQLNRFMRKLNMKSSVLNPKHLKLAEQLVSLNLVDDPYKRIAPYQYEQLQKGILCAQCYSVDVIVKNTKVICDHCGCSEDLDSAVVRSVEELRLLFPEVRITTSMIYDWCRVIESHKTVRRILNQNLTKYGSNKWIYYE